MIFYSPIFQPKKLVFRPAHSKFFSLFNGLNGRTLSRDVFVYDHGISLEKWKISKEVESFKFPTSAHIVSKYVNQFYMNYDYNFNSVGEYFVNITPAHQLFDSTVDTSTSLLQSKHSVYIFPDNLKITNLSTEDIPVLISLFLKCDEIKQESLSLLIPPCCEISKSTDISIISSLSEISSPSQAINTLDWFRRCSTQSLNFSKSLTYLLTGEMKGHRNAANVLIFPGEDSFEVVSSQEKANYIFSKYL